VAPVVYFPARPALGLLLLLSAPLALPAQRTPVEIERLDLDVRLDPAEQALSAKANMVLRNRSGNHVEVVELFIPAPLGNRAVVERAWDYHGQLAFRADPVDVNQSQQIQVALRSPLKPGGKRRIVLTYRLAMDALPNSPAGTAITSQRARLAAVGWYPAPALSAPPSRIRLSVRLPKDWRVWALAKPKLVLEGQASASYEMTIKNAAADTLLFTAAATDSPE
jgi:hypothetical protein